MIRRLLALSALLLWSHAVLALGVNFTSPTQTSYIHSASFTVAAKGTAFQDGEWVTSLRLYRDGALLASGTTSSSASVSGLPVGTYYFNAIGTNNWGQSVSKTLTITVNPSRVVGNVDGLSNDANGTPHVVGWACSTGLNQSIDVHFYSGGPAGTGTGVSAHSANLASESAVASACQAQGAAYRLSIPLGQAVRDAHGGKAIYIHGISPVGQPNDLIGNSGTFIVPTSRNAGFVAHSVPATMVAGHSYAVSVQMRNDGSAVWRPSEGYRLGAINGSDSTWGLNRVELAGDIAKGAAATLSFNAKAPTTAGTYNFQWRMLQEGVAWFGATTSNVGVRVVSGSVSGSPNPCTIQYGASTCTATISWSSTASDAEVWVTDTNNANAQLFARAQSGTLDASNVTTATSRFHLKAAGQTMATLDVAGTPAANIAPTVQLTAPSAGNNGIAPASVALSANATDADDGIASVSFYANGALLHTDTTAPYAFAWNSVPAGHYNVHAVARDTRNATATSSTVAISIIAPVANPSSSTRYYVYDQHQQLCKVVEPETRATVMEYDPAGNLLWSASGLELTGTATGQCDRTDASVAARKATRTYDARNRLSTMRFPDGRGNQDWTYTATGQPATITTSNDGAGQTLVVNTYRYNRRGMLVGESSAQPGWYDWGVGYGYDSNGNLASQSYPTGGLVNFAPNALGQPTQVAGNIGTFATGVGYYPNGAIRQFTYGNGVTHTMTQNARQLPLRASSSLGVLDYEYGYDANGNVGHIYDHARGSHTSRWMTYDGLDRLTAAGSCSFGGDCWHRFTYDKLDNITSWKLPGVKDHAEHYYEPGTHRLISIRNSMGSTTVGFGYDVQGNLANKNGQIYDFDFGNRLRGAIDKEGYRYDGHGRRVLGWSPGRGTILSVYSNAGQIVFEHSDTDWTEHVYLAGSVIGSRTLNFAGNQVTHKFKHTDALGSPVAVTNATGTVIERTDYEPYGAVIGGPKQGVGYTGHVMDAATGLTYMQQRYYDATLGRFLSVDPVTANSNTGANFNRYYYANNNPYKFTDPDGRLAGGPFRGIESDDRLRPKSGRGCNDGHACYGDGGSGPTSVGKRRIEKAWRGIAAHKIIQADIALTLPGIEVKAEHRTLNPLSGGFGRVDLMLRSHSNAPWSVFEIKPGSQEVSSSLRAAATSQINRYVDSLNAEGIRAVVGNWSSFFGQEQNRAVNTPSMEIGGVDFGGSYLYGPSESERGVIYYSTGDVVGP